MLSIRVESLKWHVALDQSNNRHARKLIKPFYVQKYQCGQAKLTGSPASKFTGPFFPYAKLCDTKFCHKTSLSERIHRSN